VEVTIVWRVACALSMMRTPHLSPSVIASHCIRSPLQVIMSILLHRPGVSYPLLLRELPIIAPSELDHCLKLLLLDDKITIEVEAAHSVTTRPVDAFSQPYEFSSEEERGEDSGSESDGERRRKRRRRHDKSKAAAAATGTLAPPQRYIFPTTRAFAV
jgi:hypothetical protein